MKCVALSIGGRTRIRTFRKPRLSAKACQAASEGLGGDVRKNVASVKPHCAPSTNPSGPALLHLRRLRFEGHAGYALGMPSTNGLFSLTRQKKCNNNTSTGNYSRKQICIVKRYIGRLCRAKICCTYCFAALGIRYENSCTK